VKSTPGLRGIGIEPEDHEFGGERAKVDFAVDDRIGLVLLADRESFNLGAVIGGPRRVALCPTGAANRTSTGSSNVAANRLERNGRSSA